MKNILSGNIRRIRKQKKMSQNALAERAGISFRGLQEIEYENAWPGVETISSLAKALGVQDADLFQDLNRPLPPTPEQALTILSEFVKKHSS